jgi:hypothetical protein
MFDINDPTREAVSRKRVPMTPEQLESYRPRPVIASQPAETAKQIAYRAGVSALEPLILRVEQLERDIKWLKEEFVAAFGPKVQ